MKLLLDQNISHRLVAPLQNFYPDSSQVALLGLGEASDLQIWELAQSQDYVIVSNDADFEAIVSWKEVVLPSLSGYAAETSRDALSLIGCFPTGIPLNAPKATRKSGVLRSIDSLQFFLRKS